MVTSMQVLSQKLDTLADRQNEIKTDVKALKEKPAKRWENIVRLVIETAIGALVLYFLARMGVNA